jgi:hypothetical protein
MNMHIKPISFLQAKQAADYFAQVFQEELPEQLYRYHIYNLAILMNNYSHFSDGAIEHIAGKDNFLTDIEGFADTWGEMTNLASGNS